MPEFGVAGTRIESLRGGAIAGLRGYVVYIYDPVTPYLAITIPMEHDEAKEVIEALKDENWV